MRTEINSQTLKTLLSIVRRSVPVRRPYFGRQSTGPSRYTAGSSELINALPSELRSV